ncbi:glutamate racemase [Pseudoalteromonas sp.]|uniref:glutamate racemase n=1 Tax=Pseudoalteromonas sp. TaxID=53249 RepID=UPI003F9E0AC5
MSSHIMVFDSGIGGTTVFEHIQQHLPNANYSYFMDNALLPYGEQGKQTIIKRLCALVEFIEQRNLAVDILVIACNTASTSALDVLRQFTTIPIVGVVPAIKPAAELSTTHHIALLATPATIVSDYTKKLITTHSASTTVHLYSSVRLVALAEQGFYKHNIDQVALSNELQALAIDPRVDILVLGCTHFPILATAISSFYQGRIGTIDSGSAIAKRVMSIQKEQVESAIAGNKKPLQCYATASTFNNQLLGSDINQVDLTLYEKS